MVKKIVLAALLHDIGKIVKRATNSHLSHSEEGISFLRSLGFNDEEVLNCLDVLNQDNTKVNDHTLATLVAEASSLSMGRNSIKTDKANQLCSLLSNFSYVNQNKRNGYFNVNVSMPLPALLVPKETDNSSLSATYYENIIQSLKIHLLSCINKKDNGQALLHLYESLFTLIPADPTSKENADISFYDHLKLTTAFADCLFEMKDEPKQKDDNFLLATFDLSGIQEFIYKIDSKNALRKLRSKSFFLELLSEHLADSILESCKLTRCNLLFVGGGHSYLLLPNTNHAKLQFETAISKGNQWLLEHYGIDLFIASGSTACSGQQLKANNGNTFAEVMHLLQLEVSKNKSKKWNETHIAYLNQRTLPNEGRECRVCGEVRHLVFVENSYICGYCRDFEVFGQDLFLPNNNLIVITNQRLNSAALRLFSLTQSDCYAQVITDKEWQSLNLKNDSTIVRVYHLNEPPIGQVFGSYLAMSKYSQRGNLESLFELRSKGIERIAAFRADVDSLGQTFKQGFPRELNSLSRMMILSRNLSRFFKHAINQILITPAYQNLGLPVHQEKRINVIYSGGDDVFVVGVLEDVIAFACDLQTWFERFSLGSLTLSAGIGLYHVKYPIYKMAHDTGLLESTAKAYIDHQGCKKNAVTLFEEKYTLSWKQLIGITLEKHVAMLNQLFASSREESIARGNSFLYKILVALQQDKSPATLPRLAYLLARVRDTLGQEVYEQQFRQLNDIIMRCAVRHNQKERLEFLLALQIYLYINRDSKEEDNDE